MNFFPFFRIDNKSIIARDDNGLYLSSALSFFSFMVHLNVFLSSFTFWLIQPNLSKIFRIVELGGHSYFNLHQGLIAFCQFVGSPLVGIICDKFGPIIGMCICQLASCIVYAIYAGSDSVDSLFISLLPGTFQHVLLASQTALSLISDQDKRSIVIGRLAVSYSLGMIIGPPLGGFLNSFLGYDFSTALSSFLCFLIIPINLLTIPLSKLKELQGNEIISTNYPSSIFRPLLLLLTNPEILTILLPSTFVGILIQTYRSIFPIWFEKELHLTPKELGIFYSCIAINTFLANLFLVGWLSRILKNETNVIIFLYVGIGFSFLGIIYVYNFESLLILSIPTSFLSTSLITAITSAISGVVSLEHLGSAISLTHASRSLTGIIAPLIAYKTQLVSQKQICIIISIASFASAIILFIIKFIQQKQKQKNQ